MQLSVPRYKAIPWIAGPPRYVTFPLTIVCGSLSDLMKLRRWRLNPIASRELMRF